LPGQCASVCMSVLTQQACFCWAPVYINQKNKGEPASTTELCEYACGI
jgi:hypothetical protein